MESQNIKSEPKCASTNLCKKQRNCFKCGGNCNPERTKNCRCTKKDETKLLDSDVSQISAEVAEMKISMGKTKALSHFPTCERSLKSEAQFQMIC